MRFVCVDGGFELGLIRRTHHGDVGEYLAAIKTSR